MSTDREWQRLCELYGEKSDAELLSLYEDRLDLTQIAQEALAQVVRERKLDVHSAQASLQVQPTEAKELENVGLEELDPNEVRLWLFRDALAASGASRSLADAGIEHRFALKQFAYEAGAGNSQSTEMALIVDAADEAEAVVVLRKSVGLFPLPEDGALAVVNLVPLDDLVVFVTFDRKWQLSEALEAAKLLAEAGISFLWRDARDSSEFVPEEENIVIEVRAGSLERAQKLLEDHFASQSGED